MLNSYQDIGDLEYNAHANIKKYNCKTWYTQQDLIQTRPKQTKADIQQIVDIFPPFNILNRLRESESLLGQFHSAGDESGVQTESISN